MRLLKMPVPTPLAAIFQEHGIVFASEKAQMAKAF